MVPPFRLRVAFICTDVRDRYWGSGPAPYLFVVLCSTQGQRDALNSPSSPRRVQYVGPGRFVHVVPVHDYEQVATPVPSIGAVYGVAVGIPRTPVGGLQADIYPCLLVIAEQYDLATVVVVWLCTQRCMLGVTAFAVTDRTPHGPRR